MDAILIALIISSVLLMVLNIFKNKKTILTIGLGLITVLITFMICFKDLKGAQQTYGINNNIFVWCAFLFWILAIYFKKKYSLKEKNFSLIFMILYSALLWYVSSPVAGGLINDFGDGFLLMNRRLYFKWLFAIIINLNIFIDYISQIKKEIKE